MVWPEICLGGCKPTIFSRKPPQYLTSSYRQSLKTSVLQFWLGCKLTIMICRRYHNFIDCDIFILSFIPTHYGRHVKLKPLCGPQFRNIIISFLCILSFISKYVLEYVIFKQPYVLLISPRAALDKQWGYMQPAGRQFDMPALWYLTFFNSWHIISKISVIHTLTYTNEFCVIHKCLETNTSDRKTFFTLHFKWTQILNSECVCVCVCERE